MKIIRGISILCVGLILSGQSSEDESLDATFEKDVLVITASEHACYKFDIYVATTRAQQTRGLMHVRYMPDSTGMLFVYRQPRLLSMWMKNTYMSLDMLFIRADGSIANIETHTEPLSLESISEPLSLESISAIEPLNFVLELNAGVTERLGIDTDSRVHFPSG